MSCFCCIPRRQRRTKAGGGGGGALSHDEGEYDGHEEQQRDDGRASLEMRRSSVEAEGSFPDIPITYKELRHLLREGLMPEARLFWWPLLPRVKPKETLKKDPKMKAIATALYIKTKAMIHQPPSFPYTSATDSVPLPPVMSPQMSSSRTRSESLNAVYSERVHELLELLRVLHDLPEPGLLLPLLGVLVRMIPSIDLCLQVCFDITSRQEWFIALTSEDHRLHQFTFKELLKKSLPAQHAALDEAGALSAINLNLIFIDFFQSLLPFQTVVRVLDCYLLEGIRVLIDFGLAMVLLNSDLALHVQENPSG